eukprot:1510178-Pleurochrysis_carterae.AAC.2
MGGDRGAGGRYRPHVHAPAACVNSIREESSAAWLRGCACALVYARLVRACFATKESNTGPPTPLATHARLARTRTHRHRRGHCANLRLYATACTLSFIFANYLQARAGSGVSFEHARIHSKDDDPLTLLACGPICACAHIGSRPNLLF